MATKTHFDKQQRTERINYIFDVSLLIREQILCRENSDLMYYNGRNFVESIKVFGQML
jgi:hypothetical protein